MDRQYSEMGFGKAVPAEILGKKQRASLVERAKRQSLIY